MQIVKKPNNVVSFKDVEIREIFEYKGVLFMKVPSFEDYNYESYNALALTEYEPYDWFNFEKDEDVILLDAALVIE